MTTLSPLTVLPEQHDEGHAQLQAHINTVVTQNQHPQPQATPRRSQLTATWQVGADGHLRMKWHSSEVIYPNRMSFPNEQREAA